jgi:excisionase family DNA binding protein
MVDHKTTRKGVKPMGECKEGKGLLAPDEVARMLGMSKPHVYNLAKSGELPSIKFGRAVRFDPKDVEAYIRKHRRETPAA